MPLRPSSSRALLATAVLLAAATATAAPTPSSWLGDRRCVLQTSLGDIELALWTGPESPAPQTAAHILRLCELGLYTGDHFFRVDKRFVAQTADVLSGRTIALDSRQAAAAAVTLPLETSPAATHDRRGLLSLARHDDPHSGGSSFSIMLGPAPHLDGNYALFGEVATSRGLTTLTAFEKVPVRKEGIFVMPVDRIDIRASYVYRVAEGGGGGASRRAARRAGGG